MDHKEVETLLLYVLIDYLEYFDSIVLCVAWTSTTTNLLKNVRTIHTVFKLPLNITEPTTCNVKLNSKDGQKLKDVHIIIWDKISRTSKFAFKVTNCLFQDVCDEKKIFGGEILVEARDLRKILPVVRHGSRIGIIKNSIRELFTDKFFIHDLQQKSSSFEKCQ